MFSHFPLKSSWRPDHWEPASSSSDVFDSYEKLLWNGLVWVLSFPFRIDVLGVIVPSCWEEA